MQDVLSPPRARETHCHTEQGIYTTYTDLILQWLLHNQVLELEAEIERAEQLVADIQAELNGGQGNEESLRNQLVCYML